MTNPTDLANWLMAIPGSVQRELAQKTPEGRDTQQRCDLQLFVYPEMIVSKDYGPLRRIVAAQRAAVYV